MLALVPLLFACPPEDRVPQHPTLPPLTQPDPMPRGPVRQPHRVILAYVAEVRGEIDPCGCPTLPFGGFERRGGLLKELRGQDDPVIHLDAGEMLVRGFATGGRGDAETRAKLLVRLSREVGLDAWAPGPSDALALGPAGLRDLIDEQGPPATSATWFDSFGNSWFPPFIVVEREAIRVGVIGLSASVDGDPEITTRDPVEAARGALAAMPSNLDLVVALSNLADEGNSAVARQVQGLAAIIACPNAVYDEPRNEGSTWLFEVPSRGRYLGLLRIRTASSPGQPLDLLSAQRLGLATRDQLAQVLKRAKHDPTPENEGISGQLASLDARIDTEGAGRNLVLSEIYPLGTHYEAQESVTGVIAAFKRTVVSDAVAEIKPSHDSMERSYVSSAGCVACHNRSFSRWTLTPHARAMESLLERGAEEDPECLSCHATGFAVKGGWAEISSSNLRKFKAVQCEACHGPMGGHPDDPAVRSNPVERKTCIGCHDDANSPDFEFRNYLARATCFAPMDDAPNGMLPLPPEGSPLPSGSR